MKNIILVLAVFSSIPCFAKEKIVCHVKTNDVGIITGQGTSLEKAFEDAAIQCYDRHALLYKEKHGTKPDEETGLLYIDICANIPCF